MNNSAKFSRRILNKILTTTLTLKRYPVLTSIEDTGAINYAATPSVISSNISCSEPQIASLNAQQQIGLIAKGGRLEVISSPIDANAETDVITVDLIDYKVLGVMWNDASHTHMVVELL
jgi:hypothetical protein